MRRCPLLPVFGVLVVLALQACLPVEQTAAVREVPQYTIQDFLGTTAFAGASFSPDNSKVLVSSDLSGIFNVYAVPVAGGDAQQPQPSPDLAS